MAASLIVELDQLELACLIIEAMIDQRRPQGATAAEVLKNTDPLIADRAMKAAEQAMKYLEKCCNAGQRVS